MVNENLVYIVDDEPDVRDALAMLVRSVGLRTVTHGSGADFLAALPPAPRGCVVLDVRMPGMSGLEVQERLVRDGVALPVIIMTGHGDIPMAVRAMKAGALDFVEKPFNDQVLLDAIQRGLDLAERVRDRAVERERVARLEESLTPREREVMAMVVEGRLNKVIAAELGLSTRTVEIHRAHIMEKMAARSLSQLVRMALILKGEEAGV